MEARVNAMRVDLANMVSREEEERMKDLSR